MAECEKGGGYFFTGTGRVSPGTVDSETGAFLLFWNQLMWGRARSAWRRVATSSATMETAISSGVTAPMSSPTGEWTRSNSSGLMPSRASCATPIERVRAKRRIARTHEIEIAVEHAVRVGIVAPGEQRVKVKGRPQRRQRYRS